MSLISMFAVVAAGFAAGAVNTIVGSGSLITYPVLVLLGVPPVSANIANTVGLVPGSIAGAWGYRHELKGARTILLRLGATSLIGAALGAALLIVLPSVAFRIAVPFLIFFAALLVALQPQIVKIMKEAGGTRWFSLLFAVFLASIYGGYFSAAQGIILLGILGLFLSVGLQEQNAIKNVLQALVNIVAAVFFIVVSGGVVWVYAGLIALGSVIGAPTGAYLAKRIPTNLFRIGIVVFGIAMAVVMAYMSFH